MRRYSYETPLKNFWEIRTASTGSTTNQLVEQFRDTVSDKSYHHKGFEVHKGTVVSNLLFVAKLLVGVGTFFMGVLFG